MSDCMIAPEVNRSAVAQFFRRTPEIHTLQIVQGDKTLVRCAAAPYSCSDRREVYSLSKSFTSTAIGILCDRGLLSTDELLIDIFPEKCPPDMDDRFRHLRVHHLLSMNTGHSACVYSAISMNEDPVSAFLSIAPAYDPGTHFTYNTGASLILSAIVERKSGMHLLDFLNHNLFCAMDMIGIGWNRLPCGLCEGGTGIHVSSDDIIKLGMLYRDGGLFVGRRLLSEEWTRRVHLPHSDNSSNETPDWQSGYGYQFWCNAREGYRGDGACGQLMVILPERGMVIAVQGQMTGGCTMQDEMDSLFMLLSHLSDADGAQEEIPPYLPLSGIPERSPCDGICWRADDPQGVITWFRFTAFEDGLELVFSDGSRTHVLRAPFGKYVPVSFYARGLKPKLIGLMCANEKEELSGYASAGISDGRPTIEIRLTTCPHRITFGLSGEAGAARLRIGGYNPRTIHTVKPGKTL